MSDFVNVQNQGDSPLILGGKIMYPGEKFSNIPRYIVEAKNDKNLVILGGEKNVKIDVSEEIESEVNVPDLDEGEEVVVKGRVFVLSGSFGTLSKDEVAKKVIDSGNAISEELSTNVSFLVAGNRASKALISEANRLGVPIIGFDDLEGMMG